jgi:glycosyltransferase involved in cell wall biosynthesis
MNLLFLGYWNADDPLTAATILPHLEILKKNKNISTLVFTSIQREDYSLKIRKEVERTGAIFAPLFSRNFSINILNKVNDFLVFPNYLKKIIGKYKISEIIARGAPAGALALLISNKLNIPFSVESFEPHAEYMLQSGIWKKWDPRYIAQKKWELKILKKAKFLFPVSNNYRDHLIYKGINKAKIQTIPCAVNLKRFFFNEKIKTKVKKELNLSQDSIVGVYAGKFGGLYYREEAFKLYKLMFDYIEDFNLIILTSDDKEFIEIQMNRAGINPRKVIYNFVPHNQVGRYLNAADFAIATYKPSSVSKYLSPVKVGEYWACGLPVLISKNIGDENDFIEKEGLGFTIDLKNVSNSIATILKLKDALKNIDRNKIREKGSSLRSFEFVKKGYAKLFE